MKRARLDAGRSSFPLLRALVSSPGHRPSFLTPRPSSPVPRSSSAGFTYITMLVVLTIVGISLGTAGKYWSNVQLRDKEEELLFRGDQYRQAIEAYYTGRPGIMQYPQSIDDLLQDTRTPAGKRHLRHQYKDPMTNEDFVLIKDPLSNRIMGVRSSSDKSPLKQSDFPEIYKHFGGTKKYSEWAFVSTIKLTQQPVMAPGFRPLITPGVSPPPPVKGQPPK
jgi:type II secretory pathway pseudopilin PulG